LETCSKPRGNFHAGLVTSHREIIGQRVAENFRSSSQRSRPIGYDVIAWQPQTYK